MLGQYELQHGITSICPATMTLPEDQLITICQTAVRYAQLSSSFNRNAPSKTRQPVPSDACSTPETAELVGIHLEGPFISPAKKGAQNEAYIRTPSASLFQKLWDASDGLLKLITIAPEQAGYISLSVIRPLTMTLQSGHLTRVPTI